MVLQFPDYDTLRLALTSGAVPPEVGLAPVVVGVDEAGRPWLEPSVKVPRTVAAGLVDLGVTTLKSPPAQGESLASWPQVLPLVRDEKPPDLGGNTPVLFELPETKQLPEFVGEMLRLGVDRQSFRWIRDNGTGTGTVLLQVIGPPYYTLLRAVDRELNRRGANVRAYVEKAPHVWVEVGWEHPLAKGLAPPEGQVLLQRPPREWLYLEDSPFQDIYEILDFKLPQAKVNWEAAELKKHLIVPLRLIEADRHDTELWVLRQNPLEQLDALVRDARESLIQRLIFAVGEYEGQTTIVLRVRPSKQPPPALVLDAEAYTKYLKLDNLFIPVGTKIHPALRRDAIRKLLADDLAQINWLRADPQRRGGFIPESLPDDSFRPLQDWVDYVLDHDRQALTHWVQEFRFDFDPFVCPEEQAEAKKAAAPSPRKKSAATDNETAARAGHITPPPPKPAEPVLVVPPKPLSEIEVQPPSHLQLELAELEKSFESVDGPLDDPRRLRLWPDMALRNSALNHSADAGICWVNLLWELLDLDIELIDLRKEPDEARQTARRDRLQQLKQLLERLGGERELTWQWVRTEKFLTEKQISLSELDAILQNDQPAFHEVRGLIACLVWGVRDPAAAKILLRRLPQLLQYLEQNESTVGLRPAWLGWHALAKLSGDALLLARVRDRLIERLVNEGYSAERDLPQFLRTAGQQDSDRVHIVQLHFAQLHERAKTWCSECEGVLESSGHYVDLTFAFGFARIGQARRSRELLRSVEAMVAGRKMDASASEAGFDKVQEFLLRAYRYRIEQALHGRPHLGALPADWQNDLDEQLKDGNVNYERHFVGPRYAINRRCQESWILEPQELLDIYRDYHQRHRIQQESSRKQTVLYQDFQQKKNVELEKRLAELSNIKDPRLLKTQILEILKSETGNPLNWEESADILSSLLLLSPRVGESLVVELLARVEKLLDELSSITDSSSIDRRATLLGHALVIAANYDHAELVQRLWPRFVELLHQSQLSKSPSPEVNHLFGQCLRSLRKLGLRDDIGRMIALADKLVRGGRTIKALKASAGKDWSFTLTTLLNIAGGWLFFGWLDRATEVLDEARDMLYTPEDSRHLDGLFPKYYANLAIAYVNALGQAPAELALNRIEELLGNMRRLRDTFTTAKYYARLHLNIIEAVVLALVSDDFATGPGARKWMDDDEYLIRRRIHRDHRAMLAKVS